MQRLRDSLADALVLFYPLAGRLERREEDGQVEVRCEDSGVGFVEAVVDGATLEDLAMGELPEQELFYLAPGHEHSTALTVLQPWTSETPPLAVQVLIMNACRHAFMNPVGRRLAAAAVRLHHMIRMNS